MKHIQLFCLAISIVSKAVNSMLMDWEIEALNHIEPRHLASVEDQDSNSMNSDSDLFSNGQKVDLVKSKFMI